MIGCLDLSMVLRTDGVQAGPAGAQLGLQDHQRHPVLRIVQHAAEDLVTPGDARTEEGARPNVEALPLWVRLSVRQQVATLALVLANGRDLILQASSLQRAGRAG